MHVCTHTYTHRLTQTHTHTLTHACTHTHTHTHTHTYSVSPGGSHSKESAFNVGYPSLIPGLGISPGQGKGYLL